MDEIIFRTIINCNDYINVIITESSSYFSSASTSIWKARGIRSQLCRPAVRACKNGTEFLFPKNDRDCTAERAETAGRVSCGQRFRDVTGPRRKSDQRLSMHPIGAGCRTTRDLCCTAMLQRRCWCPPEDAPPDGRNGVSVNENIFVCVARKNARDTVRKKRRASHAPRPSEPYYNTCSGVCVPRIN